VNVVLTDKESQDMSEGVLNQDQAKGADPQLPQWQRPTRYLAAAFLVATLALALVALLPVVDVVALGFIFSFLFYLPLRSLGRRFPRRYTLVLLGFYVLVVVVFALLVVVGFRFFSRSVTALIDELGDALAGMESGGDSLADLLADGVSTFGKWLIELLLSGIGGALGLIVLTATALFFSLLLLYNLHGARGALAGWVPGQYYGDFATILTKLDRVWVGYLTAQVIYGTLLALFSFVEYWLLGVPYPLVMAVVTGFVSLIPTIGGILASLIVAVPCLLLGSTVFVDMPNGLFALIVLLINVLITQLTYNFVALPIVGRFVKLPVVVVLVGVLIGMALGSILLAFLIVPILSTLVICGGYVLSKILKRDPFPEDELPEPPEVGFFSQLLISEEV
jgi:predicted PurR-regulated permease PerM